MCSWLFIEFIPLLHTLPKQLHLLLQLNPMYPMFIKLFHEQHKYVQQMSLYLPHLHITYSLHFLHSRLLLKWNSLLNMH